MRALYRVPVGSLPADEDGASYLPANVVEVYRSGSYSYLWSATDPNPGVEELDGAERLAGSWAEAWTGLAASVRDRIFSAQVEREEDGETVTLTVLRVDVQPTDVVVRDRIVPVGFGWREIEADQAAVDAL
jgi:hypothetical protein